MRTLDLHRHGVIEAHAGTGKTYTIVGLVLRLLRERGLRLSQILLVTYTEKAAGELLERIRRALDEAVVGEAEPALRAHLAACRQELPDCLVGTIHSVSLRLLRAFPFESGVPFATDLVDDGEGLDAALREVLRTGTWAPAGADLQAADLLGDKGIESHLGTARDLAFRLLEPGGDLAPDGLEDGWTDSDPQARAACLQSRLARAAARAWQDRKRSRGLLSFQDMLARMADAVGRDGFRSLLRRRVRVGVVDEFQDTSRLQWSIFRDWFLARDGLSDDAETRPLLYLVGDPKQSIYSFQGADVSAYLEACDHLVERHGAQTLSLRENWRSLPELIQGCNGLLSPREITHERTSGRGKAKVTTTEVETWTWFDSDSPRLAYDPPVQARVPARPGSPSALLPHGLDRAPVRLFVSEGPAARSRAEYAASAAAWIRALHGVPVDLPDGAGWRRHRLDWGDFAVVVGARSAARPFFRAFARAGVPWAFYKQEGVFASRAALELRAVLAALHAGPSEPGLWRTGLCTRALGGAEPVLLELHGLARASRWERLFRGLAVRTGVQDRLLGGEDGDKEWMDWRQAASHALDWLVAGKGGLPELVEHLGRLDRSEENAGEDRNLHARATEKQRVQILTMHASKGLEFPVVFVADSAGSKSSRIHTGILDGRPFAVPDAAAKIAEPQRSEAAQALKASVRDERARERRRLHYVALTRAKLVLVSQCFVKRKKDGGLGQVDPLSDALSPLLDSLPPGVARLEAPPSAPLEAGEALPATPGRVRTEADLDALDLPGRTLVLTSYSQIQRETGSHLSLDGRTARAEEPAEAHPPEPVGRPDDWLPRGARTGDALHELLETWLSPERDLSWVASGGAPPQDPLPALEGHGLLRGLSDQAAAAFAGRVVGLLRAVLLHPLDLGEGATLRLCDLAPADRRPEVEFHRAFGADGRNPSDSSPLRGWMVGYVDLLFRHAGRWHVLDWKTTSLAEWDAARLEESMESHGYALQADLYREVLEAALPPGGSAGRSVYLFLRAFADPATAERGIWISQPSTLGRATPALRAWLEARHSRKGRP